MTILNQNLPTSSDSHKEKDFMIKIMDQEEILDNFGNGNTLDGQKMLYAISNRLATARRKHPKFANNPKHALTLLLDEWAEARIAHDHESLYRVQDEILDVIAVAIRFYNKEFTNNA